MNMAVAKQWETQSLDTRGLLDDPHTLVDALAGDLNLTERQKSDLHSMAEVSPFSAPERVLIV